MNELHKLSLEERCIVKEVREQTGVPIQPIVFAINLCKEQLIKVDKEIILEYIELKYDGKTRTKPVVVRFMSTTSDNHDKNIYSQVPLDAVDMLVLARKNVVERRKKLE